MDHVLAAGDLDHVVIRKGFFKFEDFYAAYQADDVDSQLALVHFRITTRGTDGAENCHPFPLANGALIHNGTIMELGQVGKGKSDTCELAEHLHDVPFSAIKQMGGLLEELIGYNKVAILDVSGEVLVLNRSNWIEHEGVLYSNTSFRSSPVLHYRGGVYSGGMVDDDYEVDWPSYIGGARTDSTAPSAGSREARERQITDQYPNVWFTREGMPEYVCETQFTDTWQQGGFFWDDKFDLYVIDAMGMPMRDAQTEEEVFYVWGRVLGYPYLPDVDSTEDMEVFNNITFDLLQESEPCTSTPSVTAPPTATATASSPPTLAVTSPLPSSSTAKSLACAAT